MCPRTISIENMCPVFASHFVAFFILVSSSSAQRAVLNNGSIIDRPKYSIAEQKLLCFGSDGKQVSIPLTDVDAKQTREINQKESTPSLSLPGPSATMQTETKGQNEQSLGELAPRADHSRSARLT